MRRVTMEHDIREHRPDIWIVAIIAMITIAATSSSCFFGTATNLCENSERRCSPGQVCAAHQDVCVDIGGCGDGIVSSDKREVCDDGNILNEDGCSADCTSDESCGNNVIDTKETCDDGNRTPGDGCSAACVEETCGDSIYNLANNEECDTGGDTQACNGNGLCTIPECGDGYVNTNFTPFRSTAPEQCDVLEPDPSDPATMMGADTQECNGNNKGFDGPGSCRFPSCGDGYFNPRFTPAGTEATREQCDTGGNSQTCNGNDNDNAINQGLGDCAVPRCGDGYFNPKFTPPGTKASPEQCDTQGDSQTCNGSRNENAINEGLADCAVPKCGDGYVNLNFTPAGASDQEQCDNLGGANTAAGAGTQACNGNNNGADGPGSCRFASCGDGYTNPLFIPPGTNGEQCDDGDANGNVADACRVNCQNPFCGDSIVDTGHLEQCDPPDSNNAMCGGQVVCDKFCHRCI